MNLQDVEIVRAAPEDAAILTKIAYAAKGHWGYPELWMETWRSALTISPEFVAAHETHKACVKGGPIGFYSLVSDMGGKRLAHLWVMPDALRRGIGRALFLHAVDRAKAMGFPSFEIESDPNAAAFYERMGARRIGMAVSALGEQRRELPILVYDLNSP